MFDITFMPRNRQKRLFWALGILMYFPLIIKLLIMIGSPDLPLTGDTVDLLLAVFLTVISLGILMYLFYLVAGPFLVASSTTPMTKGRRPQFQRQWFGGSSGSDAARRTRARVTRPPAAQPRSVDVIKPADVSKTPLVAHCEFCDTKSYMPYQCKRCNGVFCDDHRLPEKHRCPFA